MRKMNDTGLVVSTKEGMAQVEIECLKACHHCPARSLCIGQNTSKGILSAMNPLNARPGDEVTIEVPESNYSKALILLFGVLLAASLIGMGAGIFLSYLLKSSSSYASIFGLFLGLFLGGMGLFFYFNRKNKDHLYPVISNIAKKGD